MANTEHPDPWRLTASVMAKLVRQKSLSATDATISALDRMRAVNPVLNAVVHDCGETALQDAARIDTLLKNDQDPGLLAGVPVTVKVNIDQAGFATTNGLKLQKEKIATEDSPVVRALRNAGAIIIGRTNTPAFSLRWFTRNSLHGATVNPANADLTPGGSSGGAAAAVAAGIGAIGHGTDIGGSIRYPAYACGIHGLRPSLGRVAAYNPSGPDRYLAGQLMAVSGPLARTIDDIELALKVMSTPDPRDPWWVPATLVQPNYQRRVALCITPENWRVDAPVTAAVERAASHLSAAGWQVDTVECPPLRDAARWNLQLWMAEMEHTGLELIEKEDDPDANIVFARLRERTESLDVAGLLGVMQSRAALTRRWQEFLQEYPVMLCPVSGQLPFRNHSDVDDEATFDRMFDAQLIQLGLPFMGLPGLAVSTGSVDNHPVGVQLIANRFREDILLDAGRDIEKAAGAVEICSPEHGD